MAVVNLFSDIVTIMDSDDNLVTTTQRQGRMRISQGTITTNVDDTLLSTYEMTRIPTNAVIIGGEFHTNGAFVSAGTATVDLGLFEVDGNITAKGGADNDDVLLDGVDIETGAAKFDIFLAGTGVAILTDQTKQLWDLLGASEDPGGEVSVTVTTRVTLTTGGILAAKLYYVID